MADASTAPLDDLDDNTLLRFSRHILLDEIGIEGQRKISDATALIVGLGGLGSPAALYLAAAGVGRLLLADDDKVEISNLQRQIAHQQASIGEMKVESAKQTLLQMNPALNISTIGTRLGGEQLQKLVASADVVLDCSDNFSTRHAINRAAFNAGTPLVSGAAVRFDGQFAVFDPRSIASPCYRCLFPEEGDATDGPCASFGVFAPLVGIIGTMQAAEALKLILGMPAPTGRLMVLDLVRHEWRNLRFKPDPTCPVCSHRNPATSVK